jgi:hypothetical protein
MSCVVLVWRACHSDDINRVSIDSGCSNKNECQKMITSLFEYTRDRPHFRRGTTLLSHSSTCSPFKVHQQPCNAQGISPLIKEPPATTDARARPLLIIHTTDAKIEEQELSIFFKKSMFYHCRALAIDNPWDPYVENCHSPKCVLLYSILSKGVSAPRRGPEIRYHNRSLCLRDRIVSEGRTT